LTAEAAPQPAATRDGLAVGALVFYHGSHTHMHDCYVIAGPCACSPCWAGAVHGERYVLAYPETPKAGELSHVRRASMTPLAPGVRVAVPAGADPERSRPYALDLTEVHLHIPADGRVHVHGRLLRADGNPAIPARIRAAVLNPARLELLPPDPESPTQGEPAHA
jgi:hypothetical protein